MTPPSISSPPFEINFKPLAAGIGSRNRARPSLHPSWAPKWTGSFDYSPDSDLPIKQTTMALWMPLPGPQTRAADSEADVTGYGGAAGGGKSYLEIGLAVTRHRRSIIFRREGTQVRDLWDKLGKACGPLGRSNENLMIWRDLPGDRTVTLAGVKNPGDWKRFQGHEFDLYAFDEATEFLEAQVRTLIAWNRTTIPGQRCRVVLSFNPPTTPEGEWVIQFFAPWLDEQHPNPAEPGELRWFAMLDGVETEVESGASFEHKDETIQPRSRTFFPARLEDNPILEATGYRSTLQGLPEPLRSQMLYGDFSLSTQDDEWQVIPTAWIRAAQTRWTADGRPRTDKDDPAEVDTIGVDVAQGGRDRTVLARRYGDWFAEPEIHPGSETPDAEVNATIVLKALTEGGHAAIDADGIGASTYFLVRGLLAANEKLRVSAYKGSERTTTKDRSRRLTFTNVRAAAYWQLREALDPSSGRALALPPSRELRADLTAARWKILASGIQLESKDDIKARLGRSPDLGDAYVMANWMDPRIVWANRSRRDITMTVGDPSGTPSRRLAAGRR